MIVEENLAEDPSAQPLSWGETELGPREAKAQLPSRGSARHLVCEQGMPETDFVTPERRLDSADASCPVFVGQTTSCLEIN